jgi:hypothetical protein
MRLSLLSERQAAQPELGGRDMLKALDTLTKIIERSIKILQTVEAFGGQRKRRKLAQTIHLIYSRLNECISTGEQIIDVLQSFARDPSRRRAYSGKHHIRGDGGIYLDRLLDRQSGNLDALADSLQDYSEIIRALDSDLYLDLQQFVAAKGVGIDWIAILLEQRQVPFDSLDLKDLEQLATRSRFMLGEDPAAGGDFLQWYGQVSVIAERIDTNSIGLADLFQHDRGIDSPVKTEQMQRLNDFLARNDLRHHLIEAKENLQKIKTFIETNFSVVELMIDVGSEQLKKKYPSL